MGSWKGLDAGGTEQLWDDDLLIDVLTVFQQHEPVDRAKNDSPIYVELEEIYPDITWRKTDHNGFRPIFRKTNPWVKLGLTTESPHSCCLTTAGNDLLAGVKSIKEVYVDATKAFQETDGTYSFAVMCRAAIEAPNEFFSLEDVEFAVSKAYANGELSLEAALAQSRGKKLAFANDTRRVRTLRAFMTALVNSGALIYTSAGWALGESKAAAEIAQIQLTSEAAKILAAPKTDLPTSVRAPSSNIKTIEAGVRTVQPFSSGGGKQFDPEKRALLLEKATSIHELLVEMCADQIRNKSGHPVEDHNSFDVASISLNLLIEVKSLTPSNAVSQLRKGLAQLLEYRFRHKESFADKTRLIMVTNLNPCELVDAEFFSFITLNQGIELFWLDKGNLLNGAGINFEASLAQP